MTFSDNRTIRFFRGKMLVWFCCLCLLSLSLQLEAGIKECPNCQAHYNDDDFSHCPLCNPGSSTAQSETKAETQIASQDSQQLAIQLFSLAAQAHPGANFVFSPDSLFQALTLLLMGASGETLALLAEYLGGESHTPAETEPGATACQGDDYAVGNCLLLTVGYQLQEAYKAEAEKMNVRILDNIDFTDAPSLVALAEKLNQMICESTQGMIPSFCSGEQWSSETVLSFINTVYFRGAWRTQFYRDDHGGPFTLSNGDIVRLNRVMYRELRFSDYATLDGWQAVTTPYAGDHEMVFVLPPAWAGLSEADSGFIMNLLALLQPVPQVELRLPPFETSSETDLNPVLSKTGLGCLFKPGGVSLGAMIEGPSGGIFFSDAQQNCAIKVNEKGTVAAAATQMFLSKGSVGIQINFNRPFLYILRHRKTKKILFIGQVYHPEMLDE